MFKSNSKLFGEWPEYLGDRDKHRAAKVYKSEFNVDVPALPTETVTDCVNADCVDVAKSMLDEGLKVCILNLASRTSLGGGAHKGASAQEESICHQSTLTQSLYQFGSPKYKHIREAGVPLVEGVYPMDINFGGVYSPCVTFFRHNADSYYALRNKTFDCPIITVASLSNREKNSINAIAEKVYFDNAGCLTDEGRVITLEYEDFYLLCVYTPNSKRELLRLPYRMEWEDALRAYMMELDKKKPVIYCGDLNVAVEEIDIKNPKTNHFSAGFSDEERAKFRELLASGFTDTFRALYPDRVEYSWWSYMYHAREKNVGWRIDDFVVSNRLFPRVKDSMIYTDIMGSDHCPIGIELK